MKNRKLKKHISDCAVIILGSFILALSVSVFLVPSRISTGGVSGIATVLLYLFGIPLWLTTLVINLLLFLLGFRFLERSSIMKTLIGTVFFSVSLYLSELIARYVPNITAALASDVWLSSIFGGVLVGIGIGLVVRRDASTGGSDFAALSLKSLFPHLSVGTIIMIIDTSVIVLSGILLGDIAIMLYSVVSLYISTKVTDFITVNGEFARRVEIISDKSDEIAAGIIGVLERGVTSIDAHGCYEDVDRRMLLCIVSVKEVSRLISIVRDIDRSAFVVISEAREVRGLGFKEEINFDYINKEKIK